MGKYKPIPGHEGPYFTTWAIVEWQPVFSKHHYFDIVVHSFDHCREHKGLRLYAFVIMPTHVHTIASAPPGGDIAGLMRDMKAFTAREVIQRLGADRRAGMLGLFRRHAPPDQEHGVWQPGYQPKALVGEKMALQKLRYVHENPLRAGYVDEPEAWVYSSARNYLDRADAVTEIDLLF